MKTLKQTLYDRCKDYLYHHIEVIEKTISDLRDAIANDTKSSMGDKYETAREMLQQDINMNLSRLQQAKQDEAILAAIDPHLHTKMVATGSIVHTTNGNFYIAVSAGNIIVDDKKYYIISPSSPIGMQLKGKKEGDICMMNGKSFTVIEVL